MSSSQPTIAVLLPCYDEEASIGAVVRGFREAFPDAGVYVYDNNSTDRTIEIASDAGAEVFSETRQGKGNVVRRMLADIDADIYVLADGDGTYSPADGPRLVRTLQDKRCDMVVGTRRGIMDDAGRRGHAAGNRFFNLVYKVIFGRDFTDILSGYRVLSRRFAKSFPALSNGFQIEAEMSVHASLLKVPVAEVEVDYGSRQQGSQSKLYTFRDGLKILWTLATLMKETRPFLFFSIFSAFFMTIGFVFMIPVLDEYFRTGYVSRVPTWIMANMLVVVSIQMLMIGIILDSVARSRAEHKRIQFNTMN